MTTEIRLGFVKSLSARQLAIAALMLWGMALPFNALVLWGGTRFTGLWILYNGWIGPITLIVAWYANVFFLFSIGRLCLTDSKTTKSTWAAAIIAMDTFIVDSILMNEGGAEAQIYGYGLGCILWLGSLCLLLIAAGTRVLEIENFGRDAWNCSGSLYRLIGVTALASLVGWTAIKGINDRRLANAAELVRLESVAVKRGPVCQVEEPIPANMLQLDGPLEIIDKHPIYPFSSPEMLLSWGIPTVRMRGLDYYLVRRDGENILAAANAVGPAFLVLTAFQKERGIDDIGKIGVSYYTALHAKNRKVLGFEQLWRPDPGNPEEQCPDYHPFPDPSEQPRKVVMASLELSQTSKDHTITRYNYQQLNGSIIGETESFSGEEPDFHNLNCAPNVGFPPRKSFGVYLGKHYPGQPFDTFRIDEVFYFTDDSASATCSGDSVYLYRSTRTGRDDRDLVLHLQKRSTKDFTEAWSVYVRILGGGDLFPERLPGVSAVRETKDVMTIQLLHGASNRTATITSKTPSGGST